MSRPCQGGARKLRKASGLALGSSPPAPRLRDPSQNCPGRLQLPTLPLLVELSAKGLDGAAKFTGCAFHIRGMSPHLVSFILEIAKAGDMVILPAMEDFVPILSSPEQKVQLPSGLAQDGPEPVVCESPAELEALLSGGHAGWQRYRNQVLNQNRVVWTRTPTRQIVETPAPSRSKVV